MAAMHFEFDPNHGKQEGYKIFGYTLCEKYTGGPAAGFRRDFVSTTELDRVTCIRCKNKLAKIVPAEK